MNSSLTILADQVFDGTKFRNEPVQISIEGGLIKSINLLDSSIPPGRNTIDARGATVLPGLINTHTHIVRGGMFNTVEPLSISQVVHNLQSCLDAGVTTVGDMGCTAGMIHSLREYIATHPEAGPSIVACGPIVTSPKGYPLDWLPGIYARLGVAMPCTDEAEARKSVRWLVEKGMDHIKLAIMHRSYADQPMDHISEPVARAVVDEAHKLGYKVLTHAHTVEDYKVALNIGVDALMHSSFEPLDADMVKRIKDNGLYVCPTLWVFEAVLLGAQRRWYLDARYASLVSRSIQREWRRFCNAYADSGDVFPAGIVAEGLSKARAWEAAGVASDNLMLLREAGVPIVFGNDGAYGFCLPGRPADELYAMHRAGMNVAECLQAATTNAADLLGCKDRGALEEGKRADVIIVDGILENDLGAIEQVREVIVAGKVLKDASEKNTIRAVQTTAAVVKGLLKTAYWSIGY